MNYKSHNIKTVRICVNITKESYEKLEKILSEKWSYNRSSLVDEVIKEYKEEEGYRAFGVT